MRSIAVVGASLAGVEAVRVLRAEGFDGELTLVGAENHRPYDRPPLSKGYLCGEVQVDQLDLDLDLDDDRLRLLLGRPARRLRPGDRELELSSGESVVADAVVLATGAGARRMAGPRGDGPAAGVHTLRTLEDADALRKDLRPGARLVVVGGGFIGAEVAATASTLGLDVTIVETQALPLQAQLGETVARVLAGLHAAHGVRLVTSASVDGVVGDEAVTGVRLHGGRELGADVVVVGIGSRPHTDWLLDSGLWIDDGVRCDATGGTSVPAVVAAGDCAAWWSDDLERHHRHQHWTSAVAQGAIAARRLLHGPGATVQPAPADYIWSDQYEERIQVAGRPDARCRVHLLAGGLDEGSFLAVYEDTDGSVRAVVAMSQPRLFGRWRRQVGAAFQP